MLNLKNLVVSTFVAMGVWGAAFVAQADVPGDLFDLPTKPTEDPEIIAAIERDLGYSFYGNPHISVGYVDLNDDGYDEMIVYVGNSALCGSLTGCYVYGYQRLDRGPFFQGFTTERIRISESHHNGMRMIVLNPSQFTNVYRWNGEDWDNESIRKK